MEDFASVCSLESHRAEELFLFIHYETMVNERKNDRLEIRNIRENYLKRMKSWNLAFRKSAAESESERLCERVRERQLNQKNRIHRDISLVQRRCDERRKFCLTSDARRQYDFKRFTFNAIILG